MPARLPGWRPGHQDQGTERREASLAGIHSHLPKLATYRPEGNVSGTSSVYEQTVTCHNPDGSTSPCPPTRAA
ncbi:MAG: hypothetical protein JO252_04755 [Planctomycetaceae bacterium]|nr:hypothetical protein [Planctomycetaceae bacterium]